MVNSIISQALQTVTRLNITKRDDIIKAIIMKCIQKTRA